MALEPSSEQGAPGGPACEGDPIAFLTAENLRRRSALANLVALADAPAPDPAAAAAAHAYFHDVAPLLDRDAAEDLCPLLRRRAAHEDRIDEVLARHAAARAPAALAERMADALDAAAPGDVLTLPDRAALRDYAAAERRALIYVNAVVPRLARARLTAADLRTLTLRMAARRGVRPPPYPRTAPVAKGPRHDPEDRP